MNRSQRRRQDAPEVKGSQTYTPPPRRFVATVDRCEHCNHRHDRLKVHHDRYIVCPKSGGKTTVQVPPPRGFRA